MSQLDLIMPEGVIPLSRPEKKDFKLLSKYLKKGYLIQPKRDGVRITYHSDIGFTRDGSTLKNQNFAELREQLQGIVPDDCIIDGEIVVQTPHLLDPNVMVDDLGEASSRLNGKPKPNPEAIFIPFDIIKYKSIDCRNEPYRTRHEFLSEIFGDKTIIPNLTEENIKFDVDDCSKAGLEGYIGRDPNGKYSSEILKFKAELEKDFLIVGWNRTNTKEIGNITVKDENGIETNVNFLPQKFSADKSEEELKAIFESGKITAVVRHLWTGGKLRFPVLVDIRYE